MKYAALLTNLAEDAEAWDRMTAEEARAAREQEIPRWEAFFAEHGAAGVVGFGAELDSPSTAKTVRVRDGETIVTDGPFAETKEQIGGFYLIDCKDLDEAIEIAAKIPAAKDGYGCVEVRPIWEM